MCDGAGQPGKTTLVRQLLEGVPGAIAFVGDDLYAQSLLARHELEHLKRVVGSAKTIFIDEAQRIKNIGLTMKLIVDHLPVTIIASGSASFELADRLSEPLTGRTHTFHLHPLSWEEVAEKYRMTAPETALEKMFVLVNIRGFSRNLRKEATKPSRYYFTDVRVRNALIRSFVALDVRNDTGGLFENWFVMERIKQAGNQRFFKGFYFWRTYEQHEIDLAEDMDGKLTGFECKWSPKSRVKAPQDWLNGYPGAGFEPATRENRMEYLGKGVARRKLRIKNSGNGE